MNRDGVIQEEDWQHIWMVPFLQSIPAATAHKKIKKYLEARSVRFEQPLRLFDWHGFITESKTFFKENFTPFLLFLSGGIAAFHYKKILSLIGKCNT